MAVTGASGALYARALLGDLVALGKEVHLIVSDAALVVMRDELGVAFGRGFFDPAAFLGGEPTPGSVIVHDDTDLAAPPASGSFRHGGMVVCPCTMHTLACVAAGLAGTLIPRAAATCLKEKRRLVLVPRETPLSLVHLRAMVTAAEAGATILPAMPAFYHKPQGLDDIAGHLSMKVLDALGLPNDIGMRWKDAGGE